MQSLANAAIPVRCGGCWVGLRLGQSAELTQCPRRPGRPLGGRPVCVAATATAWEGVVEATARASPTAQLPLSAPPGSLRRPSLCRSAGGHNLLKEG